MDCSPSSASRGPRRASGRKNGPGEWVETSGGRRQEQITTSGVWVGHPAATERARAESAQSQTNVTLLRKWTSLSQRFLTKTAAKKFQRDKSSATKMLHENAQGQGQILGPLKRDLAQLNIGGAQSSVASCICTAGLGDSRAMRRARPRPSHASRTGSSRGGSSATARRKHQRTVCTELARSGKAAAATGTPN
ncbi:unnamed protein product [Prorocentrum cordatum]|uniref:Uncharacterized protein n=1 Tax=Prorocentrum cordatum TaxID=2364126 RepID=A0ABN9REA0_9DINO|nr:unnamed protein product [Polarella glacialis]